MRMLTLGAGLMAAFAAARPASADTVVQDLGFNPIDVVAPGFYYEGYIPRFNSALGTLTDVSLSITGTITGTHTGAPFLDAEFTDEADHTFDLFGDVFETFGPITPKGVNFTITTNPADAARNAALFSHLYPGGTILDTSLVASHFVGDVTFATDTLTYTYTPASPVPEPASAVVFLVPLLALFGWHFGRPKSSGHWWHRPY